MKYLPASKRGLGHVEMIISFVFFVGFLLFVFFMLNPLFTTREVVSSELDVEKFTNNVSASVGKLAVFVNGTNDCFVVNALIPYYGSNFVAVQNTFSPPFQYTIYYGDFFNTSLLGVIPCVPKAGRNYTFGSFTESEFFIEKRIVALKQRYETDYPQVTRELGMNNFAFEFYYLNKSRAHYLSVNATRREDIALYSAEFPVRVIDGNARIKEMIFHITTWQ